jgi:hypothetical protein
MCDDADQPVLGEEAGSYWAPSADIIVTLSPTNSSSIDRRCARCGARMFLKS